MPAGPVVRFMGSNLLTFQSAFSSSSLHGLISFFLPFITCPPVPKKHTCQAFKDNTALLLQAMGEMRNSLSLFHERRKGWKEERTTERSEEATRASGRSVCRNNGVASLWEVHGTTGVCEYYHNVNITLLLIMLAVMNYHLLFRILFFFSNLFTDIPSLFCGLDFLLFCFCCCAWGFYFWFF